jgi:energy-coupling factor transporter ATP-binding protein EcfA2
MIKRLRVNNFRCLVNFEMEFDPFGVLCGPNGAGKSSVFDCLKLIRDLASGDATLGGDNERDIRRLEFTNWLTSDIQEFEVEVVANRKEFTYTLHIQQASDDEKPRVFHEKAVCGKKVLFDRDLEGVRIEKWTGEQKGFPLDWRVAALGSVQPANDRREIEDLKAAITGLIILRPNPRDMETESKQESSRPELFLSNLTSWYRHLAQEQDWIDELRNLLKDVWPDFRSFKLVDVGLRSKALQLRFDTPSKGAGGGLFFDQLSDGEKALVGLYMVVAALRNDSILSVFIDEPDNFVGLPELQPWVTTLMGEIGGDLQATLISHHPEILGSGREYGKYFWRENHTSPTQVGPLVIPEGLTASEAIARGWASGK